MEYPTMLEELTSQTLLNQLRDQPDDAAWRRLKELYDPWLRRKLLSQPQRLSNSDIDDILQDVYVVLVKRLPDFQHNKQPGAFRSFLKTTLVYCMRDHVRKAGETAGDCSHLITALESPGSELSKQWDAEHDRHVCRRLTELAEKEFHGRKDLIVFRRLVLSEPEPTPTEVAAELGMTVGAVHAAKSRVLRWLRQEAAGLIDELL